MAKTTTNISSTAIFLRLLTFLSITAVLGQSVGQPPKRFVTKKYANVHGMRMAYVEVGKGDPIVFLHGNPTYSYLWRNVMPHLEGEGRLIAPDMIGMGDSEKLPLTASYSVRQHMNYLYVLLEKLSVKERVTFIVHDWGTIMGTYWAYLKRRDSNAMRAIVIMEPVLKAYDPIKFPVETNLLRYMKSAEGQRTIIQDNWVIETMVYSTTIRNYTKEEKYQYVRPYYMAGTSNLYLRRAMSSFPMAFPLEGKPEFTHKRFLTCQSYLARTKISKLYLDVRPGAQGRIVIDDVKTWKNVDIKVINGAVLFPQEDRPNETGMIIAKWLKKH